MNQPTAIKRLLEPSLNGQSSNNVISLSAIRKQQSAARRHRNNMIKQRLMGLVLLVISLIVWKIESDPIVLILFSMFYIPMIFSRQYIMNFKR